MRRTMRLVILLALVAAACTADSSPPTTNQDPTTQPPTTMNGLPLGGPDFANAPALFLERTALPYCGADGEEPRVVQFFDEFELDEGAAECFAGRVGEGLPTEIVSVGFTIEGDPIISILRFLGEGSVEWFMDTTRDELGNQEWLLFECRGYDTLLLRPVECGNAVGI